MEIIAYQPNTEPPGYPYDQDPGIEDMRQGLNRNIPPDQAGEEILEEKEEHH